LIFFFVSSFFNLQVYLVNSIVYWKNTACMSLHKTKTDLNIAVPAGFLGTDFSYLLYHAAIS